MLFRSSVTACGALVVSTVVLLNVSEAGASVTVAAPVDGGLFEGGFEDPPPPPPVHAIRIARGRDEKPA